MQGVTHKTDITSAHVVKVTNHFVSLGLVVKHDSDKRIKKVVLTDRGRFVLDKYYELLEVLKDGR